MPACEGCSVPVNDVGFWSEDPFLPAGFAITFVTFLLAVVLLGYSLWQLRPKRLGGARGYQFYGLRTALALFVIYLFFSWLNMAIPNATEVTRGYFILGLVPAFFFLATETILVNTFTRMSLQPLVQARGYHKARRVGLGLSISFGVVAFASWMSEAVATGFEINQVPVSVNHYEFTYSNGYELSIVVAGALSWALVFMSIIWGLTFMGLAIHALRKSRHVMENQYRVVPKLMIVASIIWILRAAISIFATTFSAVEGVLESRFAYLEVSPIISAIVFQVVLLVIFILLLLAFRPHLLPLYEDGALSQSNDGRSSRAEQYRQGQYPAHESQPLQGAYQAPQAGLTAYTHEKPSNEYTAYAGRPHSSDPGIEVAHQPQSYV